MSVSGKSFANCELVWKMLTVNGSGCNSMKTYDFVFNKPTYEMHQ